MIAGKTVQQWLDRADELGAEGRFFDAHEELEQAWNAAEGETKILFQGLIQVAAGLHRLKIHPEKTDGAFYLLDRGLEKVKRSRVLLRPDAVASFVRKIRNVRAAGVAPKAVRFGLIHKSLPG